MSIILLIVKIIIISEAYMVNAFYLLGKCFQDNVWAKLPQSRKAIQTFKT